MPSPADRLHAHESVGFSRLLLWRVRKTLLFAVTASCLGASLHAADQSWNGGSSATDGNWNSSANWVGNAAPGAVSGTTNTDTATFNTAIANTWGASALNPIVIDSGTQNIKSLAFTGAAGSYFIGSTAGNALFLTASGTISLSALNGSNPAVTTTINAPLKLGGAYTITNSGTNGSGVGSGVLNIGGTITGGSIGSYALSFRGTNTNANTVSGIISNGISTTLSLAKYDAGTWVLSGANTFTGSVTVSVGMLSVNSIANSGSSSALGSGTAIFLGQNNAGSGTGRLQFTGASGGSSNRTITITNGSSGGVGIVENTVAGQTLTLSGSVRTAAPGSLATLTLQGAGDGVLSGNIGASALSIVKSDAGTWTLSGINASTTGTTVINAGTLQIGNGGATGSLSTTGTITNKGTLAFNRSNLVVQGTDFANAISGSGGVTQAGSGTLTLIGANTYTGATTISTGTLQIGDGNTTGSLSSSSAITNNGALVFNRSNAVAQGTDFANVISGSGALVQAGSSSLALGGSNTYTGTTAISAGVLSASNIVVASASSSLGNAASPVLLGSASTTGTLSYTGNTATYTRGFTLGAGGGEFDTATAGQTLTIGTGIIDNTSGGLLSIGGAGNTIVSSAIGGVACGLTKSGAGTLTLSGSNTYTGATTISSGTLQIGISGTTGSLSTSSAITNNGTLVFSRSNAVVQGTDFATTIGGTGGVTQSGTSTLTLNGANTFTGPTTVANGTLSFNSIGNVGGAATALGAPTTVANGTISMLGGILYYTGSTASTDREFNFAASGATINNAGTGTLTLTSTISGVVSGNNGFQVRGSNTTITGLIATGTSKLSHVDTATLTLKNANNSFTGRVIIANGTISADSIADKGVNSALGAGDSISMGQNVLNYSEGKLQYTGVTAASNRDIVIANGANYGSGNIENATAGTTLTLSGSVTTTTPTTLATLTLSGVGNGVLSGNIAAAALSITKSGTGTWTLSGAAACTGTTSVSLGTLIVSGSLSGSTSTTVGNPANGASITLLGGGGNITNAVTVGAAASGNTGATLSPGNGNTASPGITLSTGTLSFGTGGAHLVLALGRTSAGTDTENDKSDHINVTGSVALNGADLKLRILTGTGYALATNDLLYLIINDGTDAVAGTFSSLNGVVTNLAEGSTFSYNSQLWQLTYAADYEHSAFTSGNDIALMAIPEPGTWASLLSGFGMLIGIQKLRSRRVGT